MWSEPVVPVEPIGERGGSFGACPVDGAVGPAVVRVRMKRSALPLVRGL